MLRLSRAVLITLIFALLVFPAALTWADGGPEDVPTETPFPPTDPTEPAADSTAVVEEAPVEATAGPTEETPVVEPTAEPTEAAEEAPVVEATAEATGVPAEVEVTPAAEVTVEPTEAAAEAPAAPADSEEEATVAEIVAAAAEADVTLAVLDGEGEIVPLVSQEAADALSGGDPYFENPPGSGNWFGYTATTCPNPPVLPANCNVVANPVQSAVNAAPDGATIYIEAGVYTEQVVITGRNNLTLAGLPGAEIHAPVTLPQSFIVSGNPNRPIILVNGSTNITIQNLVVDGDGQGNGDYRFEGIGFNNSSGTISGNTVTGIRETPLSGTQHGVGIYVWNGDGVARTVDITGNTVSDYQKNGIAAGGTGLTANIDGNTVTGSGPLGTGLPAQNGIQVGFGATGSVTNNTVSDNYYTNPSWAASGILIYNTTGTVVVSGNDVSHTNVGLNVASNGAGQTAVVDSSGNTFTGNDWGASVSSYTNAGTANGTFDGDTFTGNTVGLYTDNPTTTVHNSTFDGNTLAVEHDTATWGLPGDVDATGNWWGDASGPYHPVLNPSGAGDEVSNWVLFDPWLTAIGPIVAPGAAGGTYVAEPMGRLNPTDGAVHSVALPRALHEDGIRVFYRDTPERLRHLVPNAPAGYHYALLDYLSYFDFFGFRHGWSLGTYAEPVTVCFAAADVPGTQVLGLYSGHPRAWTILPSFVSSSAGGETLICARTAQMGGIALLIAAE